MRDTRVDPRLTRLAPAGGLIALLAWTAPAGADEADAKARKQVEEYYARWIGVRAPELGSDAVDRTTGPRVRLADYGGKQILLFSFEAGDFVRAPDEKVSTAAVTRTNVMRVFMATLLSESCGTLS